MALRTVSDASVHILNTDTVLIENTTNKTMIVRQLTVSNKSSSVLALLTIWKEEADDTEVFIHEVAAANPRNIIFSMYGFYGLKPDEKLKAKASVTGSVDASVSYLV